MFQNHYTLRSLVVGSFLSCAAFTPALGQSPDTPSLSLHHAISLAVEHDPWLTGNRHQQDAMDALSISASSYVDPSVSLNLVNLASDTLDFDQEPMTQLKFAVQQTLPRGDSLALKQTQLTQMAKQYPYQRQDRRAKISVVVTKLWFDAYKAQESIALINKDRTLFEQLADVAEASYSSALGRTRQQDIVRAQLELTQLDDRLSVLKQQQEVAMQSLSQWISAYQNGQTRQPEQSINLRADSVTRQLPKIVASEMVLYESKPQISAQRLAEHLLQHPALHALEKKITASSSGIRLAKQAYKPEWTLNASYGKRSNSSISTDRSDLLSFGVSFDVPLFTKRRQDKQVSAAISQSEAIRTEKTLLLRQLMANFETNRSEYLRLLERQALFQDRLLPQMHDQAEASLTAYTNDDGDFSEVVRARISELNATIDALSISVDIEKKIAQLNYYFTQAMEHTNEH